MRYALRLLVRHYLLFCLCCWGFVWSSTSVVASSVQMTSRPYGAMSIIAHGQKGLRWRQTQAPTGADCQQTLGTNCYTPQQLQQAYALTPLLHAGNNGSGQTIVIVNSFGSPTIKQDLQQFDADYGLPDPPSFQILAPLGSVPFDANNADQVSWAEETSLDVEWAHAMAPGASIALLTSPVSETQGVQGMPQFLSLENYAIQHHLGQIISQSWGTTENTLLTSTGYGVLTAFNGLYKMAAQQQITVLAASGDSGAANVDVNGNLYSTPTVNFPASSPWVTAVGGTTLEAANDGTYQSETTWNSGGGSTGGGISQHFLLPDYQKHYLTPSALNLLHGFRGVPDVASVADPATGVPVYFSFLSEAYAGYWIFGGTSLSTPLWAGLVADANQALGHPLGFLNTRLYQIESHPGKAGLAFHDIIHGNNSQSDIPGYNAEIGWDPVTGLGSPIASALLKAWRS
ncbi:S53 family peptidase [Tengunoibacter tsumagoiensis]|uniref:Peptidase S53 domain-containing protein n=1 Tax=Tengunoibacter tsumagoiensis TaxID=2014871 RepID=A0A402A3J1_9CHLR|nr:S53 family peptidase [Tengunoibacter tsumagoiensis]GCE13642.1 hypothetical protein KTT_35010 [Tengunoibacter tsumagoiensis]